MRKYHELNSSVPAMAQKRLQGNTYLALWDSTAAAVGAMHRLCLLLGLKSSHGTEARIPSAWLVEKAAELSPVLQALQRACHVPGAKKVDPADATKLAQNLKTAISQVLRAFSNTELVAVSRGQARRARAGRGGGRGGSRGRGHDNREDNYTYAVAVRSKKKQPGEENDPPVPDPFTVAVIQLVTPEPRAQLEFLPDDAPAQP